MKNVFLTVVFAALVALMPIHAADAQSKRAGVQASKKAQRAPIEVEITRKRSRRGYSYSYTDTIDTRRFVDPSITSQSLGGPFDNGFFFSTPRGPHGGDAPYMH